MVSKNIKFMIASKENCLQMIKNPNMVNNYLRKERKVQLQVDQLTSMLGWVQGLMEMRGQMCLGDLQMLIKICHDIKVKLLSLIIILNKEIPLTNPNLKEV